jgi:putative FmdB family regulatory protein
VPLYEYLCPHCGRFETIRKFSDPLLTACPTCGRTVEKLASAPAIQFKGTGWYITDYARKSSGGDGSSKGDGKGKGEAKSDANTKAGEAASKSDAGGSKAGTASKDGAASGGGSTKS